MSYSYLIPAWFFGFDIGMEILFAIITCAVAIVAFRVNSVTKERNVKLLGWAFLFVGVSYIILGAMNLWFVHAVSEQFREVTINEIQSVGLLSLYAYMLFFIGGLVTLTYVTAGMKKGKTYYLLFGLSLLVIASSFYKLVTFRILSVFLLSFIVYQYLEGYLKNKNRKELWTLIAFVFLLLGSIDFIFSPMHYQAYVIGHILELLGYIAMLVILIKSVKK